MHFGEDETGRRVLLSTDPVVPAPQIPLEIDTALWHLGGGSVRRGLRYVSQHPAVKGWDNFSADAGTRMAGRIETQWQRCFLHILRTRRTL